MKNYLVATIKPWNMRAFERNISDLPGNWYLVTRKEDLVGAADRIRPRFIFFPHWSWLVPNNVLEKYECVCFHMSDVPYGRGGSPLQNLIIRKQINTKLSALRMIEDLDAGPVYAKLPLSLKGRAQDIYENCADAVYTLIKQIVRDEPAPQPQKGEAAIFARRSPEQSEMPLSGSLDDIYDHIRMLDADGYPHTFVNYGRWTIEFRNAEINGNEIKGFFTIKEKQG